MNNIELRSARFKKLHEMISRGTNKNIHVEESKLRLELALKAGQSTYMFNPKKEIAGEHEVTLDRNDVFTPSMWGLFLGLRKDANPQVEHLFAYVPVNDGVNPSIHPVGFQSEDANAIYDGGLQWLVDNTVMISSYPTERFKNIPETQGLFVLDSNDAAVQEGVQSQWCLEDMMQTIIPRLTIAGTRDHKISVNFNGVGLTFPVTTGYTPYLCLIMDGFLVKGGCEYIAGQNAFADAVGQW